jgi:hypothetical protein
MVATRLLLGATLVIGGMSACNDDEDTATAPVVSTNTVVVSPRVSSLRVGQTQQLAATVLDSLAWNSAVDEKRIRVAVTARMPPFTEARGWLGQRIRMGYQL